MTNAQRIVSAAHDHFDAGPMGATLRPSEYRGLVSCGFAPALAEPFEDSDIGKIKTSCAVVVRAVLHAAGRRSTGPAHVGQGILQGWLERLSFWHPAWEDAKDSKGVRRTPPAGAVFYRAYSKTSNGQEAHVGLFLFETTAGFWITCEGGGSPTAAEAAEWHLSTADTRALNGTLSRISAKPKDVWAKDPLNRVLVGWWRPELLDGFDPIVEKSQMNSWRTLTTGEVEVNGTILTIAAQSHQAFVDRVMRWAPVAAVAAEKYDVPVHWVLGVIHAESGGNPSALSPDGGYGLMQLTHPTVFASVKPEDTRDNPYDPTDDISDPDRNIDLGAALLGRLRKTVGDDLVKVASGYNAGLVTSGQPHTSEVSPFGVRETKGYITRVLEGSNSALARLHYPFVPGYTDKYIREWQTLLGVDVDGQFGRLTLAASRKASGK
jgi:soluble lytic murein transglycosylase-like protein